MGLDPIGRRRSIDVGTCPYLERRNAATPGRLRHLSPQGDEAVTAIVSALDIGYRLLDTAVNYGNETDVGEALRRSEVPRDEIRVTSKIPGRHHAYEQAIASTRESLDRLGLDQLDLHLIHWPNPSVDLYVEAWRALVQLQRDGLVTSIGVSNFNEEHLTRIIDDTGVVPAVNQIELHPYFPQAEMRKVNADLGIQTESWSPLGKRSAPFAEPAVRDCRRSARCDAGPGDLALAGANRGRTDP